MTGQGLDSRLRGNDGHPQCVLFIQKLARSYFAIVLLNSRPELLYNIMFIV